MVSTYVIVSVIISLIAVTLGAAYMTGALDPAIEQMGIMVFKAKAEAEKKKLQAQGMKEGEDFVGGKSTRILPVVSALLSTVSSV